MLKRELKVNLKSFLIWTTITIVLFLAVFLVYPSIANNENIKMIDEMVALFPKEMLKAFNMDISSIETAYGWLKTEGFIFILLITGVYSSILGSNIILKEESDKTIEYLNSLPIKRNTILKNKIICSLFYIILMTIIIGLFNYIALNLSGNFNKKEYLLLSITPLFSCIPLFTINLFISTFFHKTKNTIGLSMGITFISYFLQLLSEIAKETEVFKYFTVYTLSDIRNVMLNIEINPIMIFLSLIISTIFIVLTFINFNKKELI